MPAELISHADPGAESVHGSVVLGVWNALMTRSPTLDGQWKVAIFCDHPPELRVVVISPEGLRRHWRFDRAEEATADVIERDLSEWLGATL